MQEHLQISRQPLDKWSTREQLCLMSVATSCTGGGVDKNWPTVSRTLKIVCGDNGSAKPPDWFSQHGCAAQYSQLLDNVDEMAKPKRRDGNDDVSGSRTSPTTTESAPDTVLRNLTEERIKELKAEIRGDQEEYAKVLAELNAAKTMQLSEEQLFEMWREMEKQQEIQRIEEMKFENQMREREQRRKEMQPNWRIPAGSNLAIKPPMDAGIDMDVEEIIGASKPILPNIIGSAQLGSATSPLLSSLLKSPTAIGNAVPTLPVIAATAANVVRATAVAPTITTLLTSGSIPNSNQPAITLKSTITPKEVVQLLTRPISGPPVDMPPTTAALSQSVISPSQSAPTLSMLLEKSKPVVTKSNSQAGANVASSNELKVSEVPSKKQTPSAADSNNEEVPMDIDEDVGTAAVTTAVANTETISIDFDESDPNEEQQLLEVFENIGNIDELGIDVTDVINDEEVDFQFKGVDEEPTNDTPDIINFDSKIEPDTLINATQTNIQQPSTAGTADIDSVDKQEQITEVNGDVVKFKADSKLDTLSDDTSINPKSKPTKVETTTSSDDSNDNIPLAALETKERAHHPFEGDATDESILKNKEESAVQILDNEVNTNSEPFVDSSEAECGIEDESDNGTNVVVIESSSNALAEADNSSVEQKSPPESESFDVIVIPTDDDESNGARKPKPSTAGESIVEDAEKSPTICVVEAAEDDAQDVAIIERQTAAPPSSAISVLDTDEDSSATDVSNSHTRKDDKHSVSSVNKLSTQQQIRLLKEAIARSGQKTDDDSVVSASTATLGRPSLLRKLRDRDRSESPMIDGDSVTAASTGDSAAQMRSRRRCSSTPVIDSVPTSPASSERDDTNDARASKKSLLSIFNCVQLSKNASVFQKPLIADYSPKLEVVCLRLIDLQSIRRSIDTGVIRSVAEMQRDVLLMCQNVIMMSDSSSVNYKMAFAFMQECQTIREFTASAHGLSGEDVPKNLEKEAKEIKVNANHSGTKGRGSARKSQRIT